AGPGPVIRRFPPGYPLLLAAAALVTGDPRSAARGAALVLLAVNVLLVGWIARRISGSTGLGLAAAAFAAVASPLVEAHAWAWSEPMFVAAVLGLALVVDVDADAESRVAFAGALTLAAAAALARYVGVAVAGATAASLVLAAPRARRASVARAYGVVLAAVLPLGWWMWRTARATGSPAGRTLAFHPPGRPEVEEALATVPAWFAPRRWPLAWRSAAVAALLVAIAAGWWIARREPAAPAPTRSRLLGIVLGLVGAHLALVLVARTFFDADMPLDDRILLPEFLAVVFLG